MARITVEDCLKKVQNRFVLVHLAIKRAKQILNGARLLIDNKDKNKEIVVALAECLNKGLFQLAEIRDLESQDAGILKIDIIRILPLLQELAQDRALAAAPDA